MAEAYVADLVIRGGTIVDGTGAEPFVGDVAVTGTTISAVGKELNLRGRREFNAQGLVVAPGWVDAHTHFDSQVMWDPYFSPSSSGGVTTLIMGNCGVGVAPCQQDRRDELIDLVEAIEDIPSVAIKAGMVWEWETFEGYLAALERREFACDVGAMIGHGPLRCWVLGDRMNLSDRPGGAQKHPVQPHEIEAMAAVVRDAVAAGAMGFSTSRAIYHRDMKGVLMPGSLASRDEMLALLRAIGDGGGGVFGANIDFRTYDDLSGDAFDEKKAIAHWHHEWSWLTQIASESAGKINMSFEVTSDDGVRQRLKKVEKIVAQYSNMLIRTQIHARPQGMLQSINSRINLLVLSKTFRQLAGQSKSDVAALLTALREPSVRSKVIAECRVRYKDAVTKSKRGERDPFMGLIGSLAFATTFAWTPGYEPPLDDNVIAVSKREGRNPFEVYFDLLVPADGGPGVVWKPTNNFGLWGDGDHMRKVLEHPNSIPGVSDAGAHSGIFNDTHGPSHLLTHWARDRSRGPRIPIEVLVRKQTKEVAELFGMQDRGVIATGLRADINVIDFDKLTMEKPYVVHDLPTGASRWMQDVSGYRLTLVAGCLTFEDGRPTGALPGRLVRNPKSDSSKWQGIACVAAWRHGRANVTATNLEEYALRAAQGGGLSATARIARAMEAERSRL